MAHVQGGSKENSVAEKYDNCVMGVTSVTKFLDIKQHRSSNTFGKFELHMFTSEVTAV